MWWWIALLSFSSQAFAVCVTSSVATLREGPGTQHPITWQAPKYTPLVEEDESGNWLKVSDMDQQTHWVSRSSVSSKIRCVSIRHNSVPIYAKASTKTGLADMQKAGKYMPLKRLEDEPVELEGWLHVQDPWGNIYWVQESQVWKPNRVNKVSF